MSSSERSCRIRAATASRPSLSPAGVADGGVLLLGRSLREAYDLQETLLRALAIALLPTILVILAIGAFSPAARRSGSNAFTTPSSGS